MRTRKSIWYGVLGLNLGLLLGCEGRGVVLDGEETGGGGNSGGASSSGSHHGSGGEPDEQPKGGTGAAGADGSGGDVGAGAAPGNGGAGASGYGGAGAPGYGGAGGFGYGGDYGGAGGLDIGGAGGLGGAGGIGSGAFPGSEPPDPSACHMMLTPPVEVSGDDDVSRCFGISLGQDPARQLAAVYPEIGDPKVMHHMVLYRAPSGPLPSGECPADDAKGAPIYSWVPGSPGLELPPNVGLGLGAGQFIVELHLHGSPGLDPMEVTAGFCAILTPSRPNEAGITRLGKKPVAVPPGGGTSTSLCVPPGTSGARILATTVDLGKLGAHARATIGRRTGGMDDLLFDQPVNDTLTGTLPTVANIAVGEYIITSCLHANPTNGALSDQESARCNFWMITAPAGYFGQGDPVDCGN